MKHWGEFTGFYSSSEMRSLIRTLSWLTPGAPEEDIRELSKLADELEQNEERHRREGTFEEYERERLDGLAELLGESHAPPVELSGELADWEDYEVARMSDALSAMEQLLRAGARGTDTGDEALRRLAKVHDEAAHNLQWLRSHGKAPVTSDKETGQTWHPITGWL